MKTARKTVESPLPPAKATVLVVDDELLLRMLAVEFIEDAGYRALEAESADGAIAMLEGRPDIRIVMTDVNMPGSMDGLRFAATVRSRWPAVDVIIVSGYAAHTELKLPERAAFFHKPYDIGAIVACLNQMAGDEAG